MPLDDDFAQKMRRRAMDMPRSPYNRGRTYFRRPCAAYRVREEGMPVIEAVSKTLTVPRDRLFIRPDGSVIVSQSNGERQVLVSVARVRWLEGQT